MTHGVGSSSRNTMAYKDADDYSVTAAFAAVAFSGAYSALSGTPDLSPYATISYVDSEISGVSVVSAVDTFSYTYFGGF